MIRLICYGVNRVFILQPTELVLTRQYELQNYQFTASDISLKCLDAQDLFDAVKSGDNVYFCTQNGDGTNRFFGIIQSEGSNYDPSKREYDFTVLHTAKSIFNAASMKMESQPLGISHSDDDLKNILSAFDYIGPGCLSGVGICAVILHSDDFEFANKIIANDAGEKNVYFNFLKNNSSYSMRDHWIDLAKHYRCVLCVDNDISNASLYVIPRRVILKLNSGYDDLIADYKEDLKNPDYQTVIFPAKLNGDFVFIAYSGSQFSAQANPFSDSTQNVLDLRVPSGVYPSDMPYNNYYGYLSNRLSRNILISDPMTGFPFGSIPNFTFNLDGTWSGESPDVYCLRVFGDAVLPYSELTVLYRELMPVNPLEDLIVRGDIARIMIVEDDLAKETSKITARRYDS